MTAIVAAIVAFIAGRSTGYDDGYEKGAASLWSTVASLPIGEQMQCCGGFRIADGKWACAVMDTDKVNLWFVHTEQELPKKFVLLMEGEERKITELP
ncbi:hypothetical protein HYT95_03265 [Candidatus Peregrinibacteria bacterium]|nr:hypothetical protein [Candidatus Peregrinibacteria bacterium]